MLTFVFFIHWITCAGNIDETSTFSENFSHTSMQNALYMTEEAVLFLLWNSRCIYAIKTPCTDNPMRAQIISAILEGDRITHCGAPSLQCSCESLNSKQLPQPWVCVHIHREKGKKMYYAKKKIIISAWGLLVLVLVLVVVVVVE